MLALSGRSVERFPALGAAAVALALALVLLPVPPLALDVLLLLNLAGAAGLLWRALGAGGPQQLPQLPALLVLGMVVRLGLLLGAVRLVLTRGEAGRVALAVGEVVLAGDWAVGGAVLLGLFAVQYGVVARGGERMAEVAARFALDALPGQQAAMEAELRGGALSPERAGARREELLGQARLYGALDGALRFVRGDAAAGLVVLLLGLVGGLWLGTSEGLGMEGALQRYGLPLAGCAVLTQVPALLGAVGAGVLLARVAAPLVPTDAPAPVLRLGTGLEPAALRSSLARLQEELGLPPLMLEATGAGRQVALLVDGVPLHQAELPWGQDPLPWLLGMMRAAAPELLGIDQVQRMLEELRQRRPALVREAVPRRASVPLLRQVLVRLLQEGVSLDLRAVLEALCHLEQPPSDPVLLTDKVRSHLGPALLRGHLTQGVLQAVVVEPDLEQALREATTGPPGVGETLALEPELSDEILAGARAAREHASGSVLLCHAGVRRLLARLLAGDVQAQPVLAYSELPPQLAVRVVGRLGPGGFSAEASA
ncbi:MAG: FHIPEP family type III secretion protein [Myxococcales bacterium]|nr:flagellar biosynthesis protein FlhA [Myxococcota bacterium]MDW8281631.1 FHIPEP family type III secretion protein [Myxococcales bacterium]